VGIIFPLKTYAAIFKSAKAVVAFETMMLEELPERLVPPDWVKKWTHAEVDAGADIIVMHGAPLLHGIEIYHGRPIFYDLGNFIFQVPPTQILLDEPIIWESVVAYVEFQGKNLKSIQFRPLRRTRSARVNLTFRTSARSTCSSRHAAFRRRLQAGRCGPTKKSCAREFR
jgi:poly-gamma-glutamate capsule biosynthesis protein CapA/YwtB (metallophosphatase superfamily)